MSIEAYPSPNGVLTSLIWRKTAAGSETSLSGYDDNNQALSYTPGQEQVYLNGILLVRGEDYTATNGTSITNLSALAASDYIQINCYNNFSVASVPSTSINGEIPVGNIPSSIARIASPTFTGVPAAPTASSGTNTTQIATTAYVRGEVTALVNSAPSTLDTLNELATALGNDASFSTTVTNSLAAKAPLASPTFTGTVSLGQILEKATVSATAATGTINYELLTNGAVTYYTSNASGNWTLNLRGNSSTTLNSIMSTGQSLTIAFLVTQGSTAYYQSGLQVDGSSVTPKWQGGTAISSGNTSSVDVYAVTVLKTADATFSAFASQTKFA